MSEPNNIGHGTWGGLLYSYTKGHEPKKMQVGDNYVLVFDNNERFTYPEQKSFVPIEREYTILGTDRKTTEIINIQPKLEYYDPPTNTTIFGLKSPVPVREIKVTATTDLSYTAGDAVSRVDAYDTNNCVFDVGANHSQWLGDNVALHNGQNNQFIGDKKDTYVDEKGYIHKGNYKQ